MKTQIQIIPDNQRTGTSEINTRSVEIGCWNKYYVFVLDNELYALETKQIKEIIIGYQGYIKPAFYTVPYIKGVIGIGTEVIPVVDISMKLEIRKMNRTSQPNTLVIIETLLNQETKRFAFLFDSCISIANVRNQDTFASSLFEPEIKRYFISNPAFQQKEIIKILDVAAFMNEVIQLQN